MVSPCPPAADLPSFFPAHRTLSLPVVNVCVHGCAWMLTLLSFSQIRCGFLRLQLVHLCHINTYQQHHQIAAIVSAVNLLRKL